jgi:Xaa-Pro dipeptidase
MDMIGDDRRARLIGAMAEARLDMLLVYGNAWQCDYLRYATDFGIIEGQALALLRNDGHVTLYLDSPLEVDRAELDCPTAEVIHATDLIAEVDTVLDRLRNYRIGAAPQR